jgi:RNA polymerase sporulation-specific sigma factor
MFTKIKVFYMLLKCKLFNKLKIFTPGNIYYIGGTESLPPPLSIDEEKILLNQIKNNSAEVRSILIERNLRLVVYIAKKFENTSVNVEDLISIGTIGLIKAINTFNPERNIKLATYASRCIENEILMYLRRTGKQKSEVSLDEPLKTDWDGNELLLSDVLGSDSDSVYRDIDDEVDHELLKNALQSLNMREKTIMDLRFGLSDSHERTQKEVADMLGISQSYISRLEKRILNRLKHEMIKMY